MYVSEVLTGSVEGRSWPLRGPVFPLFSLEQSCDQDQYNPPEQAAQSNTSAYTSYDTHSAVYCAYLEFTEHSSLLLRKPVM